LGRRQAAADRTRAAILAAARDLLVEGGPGLSAAAVAQRAGVSRITVYNRFGSMPGLLREVAEAARGEGATLDGKKILNGCRLCIFSLPSSGHLT